jgi:uncharacterized protein (TIGR02145 family)
MKTILFLMLFMLFFSGTSGQDITISFQPKDGVIPIDSILVTNQKTNQKVKLSGSESLLLTKSSTGIPLLQANFGTITLYPNPCYGDAVLHFSTIKSDEVRICIYSNSGQLVNKVKQILEPGFHHFLAMFPTAGIYFLFIMNSEGSISYKVVCTGKKLQNSRIVYRGSEKSNVNSAKRSYKIAPAGKTMTYSQGDILLYSAFLLGNNTVMTDSPKTSQVYNIEFHECIDSDKIRYPVVKIGTQWWMAKNLACLPSVNPSSSWSSTSPLYYVYGYEGSSIIEAKSNPNYTDYGVLYNWPATTVICPSGWHLPSDAEWTALTDYLGYFSAYKMKETGTVHWLSYNEEATNESGFTALPGGRRLYIGGFINLGDASYFWSGTPNDASLAWRRSIAAHFGVYRNYDYKNEGYSVRCVKDSTTIPSNHAPNQPSNPNPENNSTNTSTTLTLTWDCSDPDNDVLTYDIYFGISTTPSAIVSSNQVSKSYSPASKLTNGTNYFWKIIAKDSKGAIKEGPVWKFTTSANETGTFTDTRDNKTYKTVKIGNQWWMAENLAYLPVVSPASEGSETTIFYYVYDYNGTDVNAAKATGNYASYGVLYNWSTAMNGAMSSSTNPSGVQGACPKGWHLPSDGEWTVFENYLSTNGYNYDGPSGGNRINKALASKVGWNTYPDAGTPGNDPDSNNRSGFSGFPAGTRVSSGSFGNFGTLAAFWSSTEYSVSDAWQHSIGFANIGVYRINRNKSTGSSVRCVKD